MSNTDGYKVDYTLLKMIKPNSGMRIGNWDWVHCEDGRCIFTVPYGNKSIIIKNEHIREYMNQYIAKNKSSLPVFYWKKIKKNGSRVLINDANIIIDGILSLVKRRKAAQQKEITEKAFITHGRTSSVRRVDKITSRDWELKWEDIKFYDGYFVFRPNLEGKVRIKNIEPLRVNDFRCKRSFNYIIKYFKARLPKITYHITADYRIELDNKPDFDMVLVDLAKEQMRHDNSVEIEHVPGVTRKLGFAEAVSKGRGMNREDFKKYKSKFIDFLVDHQIDVHKVVPVTESISHRGAIHDEEGFIFTAKSGVGRLLIIVENVNPDRATMLFKVSEWNYKVALHTIFDYVQSDALNKRSAIRDQKISFREAGVRYHWTSNHDSFHDWKVRMLNDFM